MNIVDHGQWEAYIPATFPPSAPVGTLFSRRQSDGVDWYDYVKTLSPNTVQFLALWVDAYNGYVVSVATYDQTMLFPGNQILREITDYAGTDPQADFGNKLYDPAAGTFSPLPPLPPPLPAVDLNALQDRIAALEAKQGGA